MSLRIRKKKRVLSNSTYSKPILIEPFIYSPDFLYIIFQTSVFQFWVQREENKSYVAKFNTSHYNIMCLVVVLISLFVWTKTLKNTQTKF